MSLKGRLKKKASKVSGAVSAFGKKIGTVAKTAGTFVQAKAKNIGESARGIAAASGIPGLSQLASIGGSKYSDAGGGGGDSLRSSAARIMKRRKGQAGAGQISFNTMEDQE